MGALAADRKAATVTEALVAADLSILRLMSWLTSRRRSPSTRKSASMTPRILATSSSVRSRTRVVASIPVALQMSIAIVRPMP